MAYSTTANLDWGGMPEPANAEHWLNAAADEIDSEIGHIYVTPVVLNPADPAQRPGHLLLKRINEWLAVGRGILSAAYGNEDDQVHAAALYYVTEARNALMAIKNGQVNLIGAEKTTPDSGSSTGPLIGQVDETSAVESFRTIFGDPAQTVLSIPRCPVYPPGHPLYPYTW